MARSVSVSHYSPLAKLSKLTRLKVGDDSRWVTFTVIQSLDGFLVDMPGSYLPVQLQEYRVRHHQELFLDWWSFQIITE